MLNTKNKPVNSASTTSTKSKNNVIISKSVNNSNSNNNYLLQQPSSSNSTITSSSTTTPSSYSSYSQQQQFFAKLQSTQSPTDNNTMMHSSSTTSRGHTHQPSSNIGPSPNSKFLLSDFTICRTLGTGSFGRVHLVQSKYNSRFYAMKVLKKSEVVRLKQVEHTNNEKLILEQVQHSFLVNLWGTFQDSANLYMVMDYVVGGELFSILRKNQVRYHY
jgi:hypothetical protein